MSSNLQCSTVRVDNLKDVFLLKKQKYDKYDESYLEVDHRVNLDVDIVASDDGLSANGADLDLHIHDAERLCTDVDVGEPRVYRLVEVAKAGNESHRTCRYALSNAIGLK